MPTRPLRAQPIAAFLLVLFPVVGGCISYETRSGDTSSEVLGTGPRTRTVAIENTGAGQLIVEANESWTQEVRTTTEIHGGFEVDPTLSLVSEAPEMIVISPILLALDLVGLVITGPIAVIEAAVTGDEVYDSMRSVTEPVADLSVTVRSGNWEQSGATDANGYFRLSLREPATLALHVGRGMEYGVLVDGEPPALRSMTLPETITSAALPRTVEPAQRFAHWQQILAKCASGEAKDLVQRRAERIDPATLRRYRQARGLPGAMSLLAVDNYRERDEQLQQAREQGAFAEMSTALGEMAELLAELDAERATGLRKQAVEQSANYVLAYYAERSLRSTPSFMVRICSANLDVAQRYDDRRSAGIFSAVLAARAGDARLLVHGRADHDVARLHERATEEIRRQAAQAAYAAEVARMKREEEAWHYRYLNGRGGRGSTITTRAPGSPTSFRGANGPSVAEQARAHRAWLQKQEHNAANRNRAFDQFDRND